MKNLKLADKRFAQPFAAHGSSGAAPGEKQGVVSGIEPGHGLLQPLENGAQKKGRQQEQRGGEQEDDDVGCKGSGSVCVLKKVYCKAQGKVNHGHEQCEEMRPSGGSLAQAIKAGAAAGTAPGFTGFDVLHCQSAAAGRRQGEGGSAVEANGGALPRGVRSKEEGFLAKGQGEAVGKAIVCQEPTFSHADVRWQPADGVAATGGGGEAQLFGETFIGGAVQGGARFVVVFANKAEA